MSKRVTGLLSCSPQNGTIGHCYQAQLWGPGGDNLAVVEPTKDPAAADDTAARLAACWNSCERAGLSTEALEAGAVEKLIAVCEAYEAWESDLVLNGDWRDSTVRMTQSQHDRLIEIQAMRNAVLAAKGVE